VSTIQDNEAVTYKIWGADDVVYGPVELPMLVEWVQDERVEANTWIYCMAQDTWAKAAKVQELAILFNRRAARMAGAQTQEATPLVAGIKPGMLRRVKILADMNDQQLGRFVQFMEVQQVPQFREIVKQGEHGDSMFLVLEGEVRARLMISGKETTLMTLGAGEFFGEMSLFDQQPRSADVVANKDCVLLKVSADKFEKLVKEQPDLATPFLVAICRSVAGRLRGSNKKLKDTLNFGRAAGAGG
jgi:hypothetical protein